ncbi:hypothetical protein RD792_003399 [Penstemon davidsonii]|uniref:glutathione transferase n=1 Tax=Penstemon davidsonii TaxID=160366 RepID=A0ABR0DUS5_9LAMI|nr:hypothetical protein RD792_003399 [Penstemon davidsonii]
MMAQILSLEAETEFLTKPPGGGAGDDYQSGKECSENRELCHNSYNALINLLVDSTNPYRNWRNAKCLVLIKQWTSRERTYGGNFMCKSLVNGSVYGSVFTTATMRVFACLDEEELDYEIVPVGITSGEHKMEYFLSLNGKQLINHDANMMGVVSMWMKVKAQKFDTLAMKLTWELIINPGLGSRECLGRSYLGKASMAKVVALKNDR